MQTAKHRKLAIANVIGLGVTFVAGGTARFIQQETQAQWLNGVVGLCMSMFLFLSCFYIWWNPPLFHYKGQSAMPYGRITKIILTLWFAAFGVLSFIVAIAIFL